MFAADLTAEFADRALRDGLTVLIGSGSTAAANLGGLVDELRQVDDSPVVVILTEGARRFVTAATVRHLGRCPVLTDETTTGWSHQPLHVWLTDVASRVLVYPASAGFLGRTAAGCATDLASTTLLCATGLPVLLVPSMHRRMWTNPLVRRNVSLLRQAGFDVLDVVDGLAPPVELVVAALPGRPIPLRTQEAAS